MNFCNLIPSGCTVVHIQSRDRARAHAHEMYKWLEDKMEKGTYTALLYKMIVEFQHKEDALAFSLVFEVSSTEYRDFNA